jgi:hypothetical protein
MTDTGRLHQTWRWDAWILVAMLLVAAAVWLRAMDAQSIWFDEGWSAFAAAQPTLQAAFAADPTNPPLYYVLLNITARAWGDSPFGLRVTSLLLGLLIIPLTYQLARRWFNSRAGRWAALLAGCSPLLWWAAQEARMYTLLAVLVLAAALAWQRLWVRPDRAAWASLLTAETLLLYAHNTGPVIVLWLNGLALAGWLTMRSLRCPDWRYWLGGQVLVGVLWLPWLLTRFVEVQAANSAIDSGPQLDLQYAAHLWQGFWTAPWPLVGQMPVLAGFALVMLVVVLALTPWRQVGARWLALSVLLLTSGLLLGLTVIGNDLHGRYLVMIVPLLLTLSAAGIARLPGTALRGGVSLLLAGVLILNLQAAQDPAYQHDDVRGMVRYYAETLTADDTVLAWSYADRYDLAYYWERLGVSARRVTLPEGADFDAVRPLLPEQGRVALNIWYTQRADYRGMLPCLLGHGTINPPLEFTVYGMSSQLYEALPMRWPDIRPLDQPVLHAGEPLGTIIAGGTFTPLTAERAICVPVTLRLNQPAAGDLRAAVLVHNPLGQEIASASAILATANQRTTSSLSAGDVVTAYALLRLPYGAPPGEYPVLLRIFDPENAPSGYDVPAADGRILGKDFPLGVWSVEPGADWSQVQRDPALPYQITLPYTERLTLIAHNLPPGAPLAPGQALALDLLWQGSGALPELTLTAMDESWSVTVPPLPGARDTITRDWRLLRVPADAAGGAAELRLPNGTVLATFTVDALPRLDTAPEYAQPVNAVLGEVGMLVGYSAPDGPVNLNDPLAVTLVWQAGPQPIGVSYTVFVQLLNADGQLIAQSDAVPAQGSRPTTGWRTGEYIVDTHQLQFNERAAPGEARLIAGMYDALTGERLRAAADGRDYIELPGRIMVR